MNKFYEVALSDCDCRNVTIHVWSDGKIDVVKCEVPDRNGMINRSINNRGAVARMMRFFHDPEAPDFVIETLKKPIPKNVSVPLIVVNAWPGLTTINRQETYKPTNLQAYKTERRV